MLGVYGDGEEAGGWRLRRDDGEGEGGGWAGIGMDNGRRGLGMGGAIVGLRGR